MATEISKKQAEAEKVWKQMEEALVYAPFVRSLSPPAMAEAKPGAVYVQVLSGNSGKS